MQQMRGFGCGTFPRRPGATELVGAVDARSAIAPQSASQVVGVYVNASPCESVRCEESRSSIPFFGGYRRMLGKGSTRLAGATALPWPCGGGVWALGLAAWVVAGCGEESPAQPAPEPPRAVSITVSPTSASLAWLGETVEFSGSVRDQHGAAFAGTVEWASSDEGVFTVSTGGVVTAVGNGAGTLTASFQALSAMAAVDVEQVAGSLEQCRGMGSRLRWGRRCRCRWWCG